METGKDRRGKTPVGTPKKPRSYSYPRHQAPVDKRRTRSTPKHKKTRTMNNNNQENLIINQPPSMRGSPTFQVHDEACFVEPINSDHPYSANDNDPQHTKIQPENPNDHPHCPPLNCNSTPFIPSPIHEIPKIDFLSLLPVELAIYILLNIGDHAQSLVRCRLVSKHWRQCAEDPIVWREIFLSHPHWKVKRLYLEPSQQPEGEEDQQFRHNHLPFDDQFDSFHSSFRHRSDHDRLDHNPTHILDDQPPSRSTHLTHLPSSIPNLSRQNSIQFYRSSGSANKHVARRLSQLLSDPSIASVTTHQNLTRSNQSTHLDHQESPHGQRHEERNKTKENMNNSFDAAGLMSLDWLTLFRDRFILDQRWSDGKQITRSLKGHKDSIYCLQLNGNQIITGSRDRTIKLWDMKTGTCMDTLTGHKGSVLCVRCDGQIMLTGSSDCQVFIWEEGEESPGRTTWQAKRKLIGHQAGVLDLGLEENFIVSCSKDTTIKIWNREDGALVRTITGHTGPVNALELCRNPLQWIEKTAGESPTPHNHNNNQSASTGLLTASGDSTMKLWELQTGRLVRTFEGHIRGLACLKLVEASNLVVTGSNDETIKFWNLTTGQCLRTLLGHSGLVRSLDIDIAQNRLVSGS